MTTPQKGLKRSRTAWAARCLAVLAFSTSLVLTGPARAEDNIQTMVYEVYAGGIHALQARLDIDLTKPDHYALELAAKTRGLLAKFAPWHGSFVSHGWKLGHNDYRPETHKSTATWKDETEVKEYRYTKDRDFKGLLITDHNQPTHTKEIDSALTQGTTDALTATLTALQNVGDGKDCEGSSEVFDGKRRFKLNFRHKDYEDLTPTEYNIYEGKAAVCTVEVEPVSGEWHKKPRGWLSIQEQGRKKGTMPTVWMAKINENGPAVPVKILVKTDFGGLYMHLSEYRNGENIIVADKRAGERQ